MLHMLRDYFPKWRIGKLFDLRALVLVGSIGTFSDYITGMSTLTQSDHNPLILIFQSKLIDELAPRLQLVVDDA